MTRDTQDKLPGGSGRIVARNTAFGVGAQFALKIASFCYTVLVIRNLGNSAFGQYSIVLAWAGLFAVFGDMGISQYLTREIARDHTNANRYFWDVVSLRLLLSGIASVITVGGAILYGYSEDIVLATGLYTISYLLAAFLVPLISILDGNERVDVTAMLSVLGQIISMILGGLVLYARLNFIWLVVAGFLNMPVLIVFCIRVIRRNDLTPPRFHIDRSTWRKLLIAGFPFALAQISLSFAFDSDTIVLSHFYDAEMVGWYATAYRLMIALFVFAMPFNQAILPTLSRLYASDPETVRPWYYRTVKVMMILTFAFAIGGTILADKMIVFLYGPDVLPAAVAFGILTWYLPFHFYTSFAGVLAVTMQREGRGSQIFAFEGVLNIVLNLLLIPPLGIIGASIATVLTMLAGSWLFYILFRRALGPGLDLRRLPRLAVAGIIMGIVVWFLRDTNLFVAIIGGGLVYTVMVFVLGAISPQETAFITAVFRRIVTRQGVVTQQP